MKAVSAARPALSIKPAEWMWLAATLVLGAVLVFWGLADKSPTPDEAFSYFLSIAPISQLLHITAYEDFHPPLFYLIFHGINSALRLPVPGFRYFTAAFQLLTILATWGLARRWYGAVPAVIAAILVAVEPLLVAEARLFRMYVVVTGLAAASWWLLVTAQDKQGAARRWLWLAYGALVLAMPYLLYLAALVVVAQAVYGIVNWRKARPAFFWALAAGAATIPWWWAVRIQMPAGAFPNEAIDGWRVATDVLLSTPPDAWRTAAMYASVTLLAFAIIFAGSWLGRSTALPFMFVPLALQVVLSVVLHKDLVVHRYLAASVPAFALALTACIAWLATTRARLAAAAVLVVALSVNAVALANALSVPYYQTTDWYAIEIALHEHSKPSDALVFDQWGPTLVLQGSPDIRGHDVYRISSSSPPQDALAWIDGHDAQRVWYVENLVGSWDPQRIVYSHLHATRPLLYSLMQPHAAEADRVLIQLYGPRAR